MKGWIFDLYIYLGDFFFLMALFSRLFAGIYRKIVLMFIFFPRAFRHVRPFFVLFDLAMLLCFCFSLSPFPFGRGLCPPLFFFKLLLVFILPATKRKDMITRALFISRIANLTQRLFLGVCFLCSNLSFVFILSFFNVCFVIKNDSE